MKRLFVFILPLVIALSLTPSLAAKDNSEKLDHLKEEAAKAVAKAEVANPKDCTKDCLKAAQKLVELSDYYFAAGNAQDGHTTMDQAGRFALKAGRSAIDTKKRRKDTEIGLRKLQMQISDIGQTLSFEDRAPLKEIESAISRTRTEILMSMFHPEKELGPANAEKENP